MTSQEFEDFVDNCGNNAFKEAVLTMQGRAFNEALELAAQLVETKGNDHVPLADEIRCLKCGEPE